MRRFLSVITASIVFAGIFNSPAQIPASDKAQSLLEEVQNRNLERVQQAKLREVERMNEDLAKDQSEAKSLQLSIEPMKAAVTDSANRLAQLNARKKQFAKMTEIVNLQIDAETLKVEGLKMLADAQAKGVLAVNKRIEQSQVKKEISAAKLNPSSVPRVADAERAALETERRIDRADRAASSARVDAREAMTAATAKLQTAQVADEKARARAKELGIPIPSAPVPSQEAVEPLKDVDPLKEVDPEKVVDPVQTENAPIALPVEQ